MFAIDPKPVLSARRLGHGRERRGSLDRESERDAIGTQVTPPLDTVAKPFPQLLAYRRLQLTIVERRNPQHRRRDQSRSRRCVRGSHLARHTQVVDKSPAFPVEHQDRLVHGRLFRRKIQARDAPDGRWLRLAEQSRGGRAFCGDDDRSAAELTAIGQTYAVLFQTPSASLRVSAMALAAGFECDRPPARHRSLGMPSGL